jgi:hypothetical protein
MRGRAAVILIAAATLLVCAAVATGLPPFSTAPKVSSGGGGQSELFNIVARCHANYDRFVIRARSATPGYNVRYVRVIPPGPSGLPVSLPGAARLHVRIEPARGHTVQGTALLPGILAPSCANLRQIKLVEDFEGVVRFGLGLRRRTGFRVFRLTHPIRVVVDVSH